MRNVLAAHHHSAKQHEFRQRRRKQGEARAQALRLERFGLEHALRAILAAGGSIEQDWTIEQVIEVGDKTVGVPVLRELYEEMGSKPVTVDLESFWRQLGIQRQGSEVTFDDRAPLAGVRRAITEGE